MKGRWRDKSSNSFYCSNSGSDLFRLSIVVFKCRQIQESYPPLFQQQDKTVFPVPTATVISTCRYFKLGWNTSRLSQSDSRNFSASSERTLFYHNNFLLPAKKPLRSYISLGLQVAFYSIVSCNPAALNKISVSLQNLLALH